MQRELPRREVVRYSKALNILAEFWGLDSTLRDVARELRGAAALLRPTERPPDPSQLSLDGCAPARAQPETGDARSEAEVAVGAGAPVHQRLGQVAVAFFKSQFKQKINSDYILTGPDYHALRQMQDLEKSGVTEQEVVKRLKIAFANAWFLKRPTLATFLVRWNEYGGMEEAAQKKMREVVGRDHDGKVVYK